MADPDRDEKLSAGYRALGSEEPPPALDSAILAAARRRSTRLRVPHLRWRVPLSVAAVLVLAVGVTLRMLPERPDAESVALAPQVMETPRPAAPAQEAATPAPRAAAAADVTARPAPPSAAAGAVAESRMRMETAAKSAEAVQTPEAWLARIVELRKQGRRREADESLAEFRKRYPGYRIPEPLR